MSFDEITGRDQHQIHGAITDGLKVLDLQEEVVFQSYSRQVLPLDGYVFWIPGVKFTAQGSLHYAQEILQNEDETYGLATVNFTSTREIVEFETAPTNTIYVATHRNFRYAFSQQNGFYRAAGVWHYFGHSIPPALLSQLVDRPGQLDPDQAVVSNSLPLWLALNSYAASYYDGFVNNTFRSPTVLYPSFAVPPNQLPPYIAVHIEPAWTRALQPVPLLDRNRNHYQLAADKVRVTMYGLQNNAACDFLDCVLQYSVDTENFGVMNTPIIMDGKRAQPNLEALAMQKFIEFEVDYYQTRVATVARQLLKQASVAIEIAWTAAPPPPKPPITPPIPPTPSTVTADTTLITADTTDVTADS